MFELAPTPKQEQQAGPASSECGRLDGLLLRFKAPTAMGPTSRGMQRGAFIDSSRKP